MGLPSGGKDVRWPPQEHQFAYMRFSEHSAWYDGSPLALAAFYGGYGGAQLGGQSLGFFNQNLTYPEPMNAAAPLWRKFMFWAKQPSTPVTRFRMHVPAAADIAAASADLLFSEEPDFFIPEAKTKGASAESLLAQEKLLEIVEEARVHVTLLEGGEVSSALGGVYLKTGWDKDVADCPLLLPVHADAAVPEFRYGRLRAVTFWRIVQQDTKETLRWLERHEFGHIFHGLYRGDFRNLGQQIPLAESAYTTGLLPDIETGMADRLTAVYIPNMRPNRADRASDLGRSDYAGIESLMDSLDECYSDWMRDLRLGKNRLVAPKDWIRSQGRGQGAEFDLDREVWEAIDAPPGAQVGVTVSQFQIRAAEHQATADSLFARIIAGAGYSGSTFGLRGEGTIKTATEIAAREQRSLVTRGKKAQYWGPQLAYMLETMLTISNKQFGGPLPMTPRVEFADSVRDDVKELAATAQLLRAAQAASTETLVRLIHPDWSDEEVDDEVAKISSSGLPPAISTGSEPPLPPGPGGAPPEPGAPPEVPSPIPGLPPQQAASS